MMPWQSEEKQRLFWKNFLLMSFFWLFLSLVTALLLITKMLFPSFLDNISFLTIGQLSLYIAHPFLFGWLFPFLLYFWFRRLSSLTQRKTLLLFPLLEAAHLIWTSAMFWGFINIFVGRHSIAPWLNWPPEFYGILAFASLLYALLFTFNIPRDERLNNSPSLLFALIGFWGTPLLLFFFAVSYTTRFFFLAPSFFQMFLHITFFLPAFAFLLPLQKPTYSFMERRRYLLFFWSYILLLPWTTPLFSSLALRTGLIFLLQIFLSSAVLSFGVILWRWWAEQQFNFTSTLDTLDTIDTSKQKLSSDTLYFFRSALLLWGLSFLAPVIFAWIRWQGALPSPAWQGIQTLLLLGGAFLTFLGLLTRTEHLSQEVVQLLRRRLKWFWIAFGLLFFGFHGEGIIHYYADLASLPRFLADLYFFKILLFSGFLIFSFFLYHLGKSLLPVFPLRKI